MKETPTFLSIIMYIVLISAAILWMAIAIEIYTPIDITFINAEPTQVVDTPTSSPITVHTPVTNITSSAVSLPFGETAQEALNIVKSRGRIYVAASIESGPYSYFDKDNEFKGFEVELVREFVRRWFDLSITSNPEDEEKLIFTGVRVIERESELKNNKSVDFLVGGVSFTDPHCSSQELICTSRAHYSDLNAILVRLDSKILDYCDSVLDTPRTYITVLSNTAATNTLDQYKSQCGFTKDIKLDKKPSRQDAFDDVKNSNNPLKVYKTERRFLEFYVNYYKYEESLRVIPDNTNSKSETYVVWLTSDKKGLQKLIEVTLDEMRQDGKFKEICQTSFGESESYCNAN